MDPEGSPESKEKTKLALLSKEELISKCTKLLHISRQAQLAKQETTLVVKQLQEKFDASEQINETLQRELKESNQIRDNVVKKLGLVSVETKQLIEQGEKLTTDIETLKQEKLKVYEELSSCQKQNGILTQNIGDLEVRLMQMNEVKGEMEFKINELNKKNRDKAEVSDTIRKLNEENMDLKQKNELHESENQIIQKTIDTLEKTLDNKEKIIRDCEERTKNLELAEKEAREKIDEVTKGSEDRIKNLQEMLEEKEKTIEAHIETIAQLKENICDIDNEIKNVKNIVKQKDVELEKLPTSLSEKDRLIENLKASIRDNEMSRNEMRNIKDEKLEEMELEIEEKSNKLESLENELKESTRKCNALEKQNEVIAEKINEVSNELSNKNDAIEKLENDLIEKDRMFKITLQNKETECNQLLNSIQIELDDKVQQFVELDALLLQNKTMLEKTLDHVTNLENNLKVKDTDIEQAQNKIELLVFELDEKSILLKQLESDASQNDEKLEALNEELKNKQATIKDLESKIDDVHQRDEKLDAVEEELKTKEQRIQELEKDVSEKDTLLNTRVNELKDKNDHLQHFETKLSQKDEVLFNLEKDLRQRDDKIEKLENDLKGKEELLDELKASLNESKKNMQDTLIEELNTLENNYKETRSIIDALEATVKEKEESIKILEDTNKKLTKKLAEETDHLKSIQTELAIKTERIAALEVDMENEKAQYKNLQKEIADKSERISQLELIIQNNEDSQREKSNSELEKNENFKLNLQNLENDNIKCKLEIENLMEELAQSNQMCKEKQGELENLKGLYDTLSGNYEKINTQNKSQRQYIESSSQILNQLKCQKQDLVSFVSATQQAIQSDILSALKFSEKMKTTKTEQEDLLKEMALMNENLKGRGEKIYSLNEEMNALREATSTLEREKCAVQANLDAMTEQMKDLKEELREEKDVQRRMSEQIEKMKDDAKKKEEECQRKQELLVSTSTQSVSQAEPVVTATQNASQAESVTMVTLSASSAADVDNKMETLSTSTLSRADESNRMKDIEDTYEDRYMKLKLLTIKYKKSYVETNEKLATVTAENTALIQKLQALSNQIKTASIVQSEYDSLCEKYDAVTKLARQREKTLGGAETRVEELEKKVEQLRGSLAEVTEQRSELQVKHAQLREKFDEQQASDIIMKDKDHEIAKLSDTNAYLSEQIVDLRARIAQYHAKNLEIAQYEKQIAVLGEMKEELQAKLNSLEDVNDQLRSLNATHSALVTSHSQLQEEHRAALTQLTSLSGNYETAQRRIEELLEETTSLCRDRQSLGEVEAALATAESRVKEVEVETIAVKLEKANLMKEFEAYKRKAQSVLEKQKKGQMDATSASVEETNAKLTLLEKEMENVRTEFRQSKSDLTHAKQSLVLALAEKENLSVQLEHATSELSDKRATAETLKQDKINADMMIIMYKQQVDESRDQIKSLKQTLADLREESCAKQRLSSSGEKDGHPSLGRNVLASSGDKESHPNLGRTVSPRGERWSEGDELERRRIEDVMNSNSFVESLNNMASLYREEGEGSEYTDTPGVGSHVPIPLDELLSSNEDQFQHEEDILSRLSSCQSQVLHLTTLLNESENNAARNEQQTNFLKEEIRRLQRTVDRQPHVQNTEYLKNVIIKFLTLQGGDERQRLVPVLNTMLKLSPEEVKQLSGVAKGYSAEASGWSSLLGGWTASSST